MLYDKNKNEHLSTELFKQPTKEYRGTPFWSWNGEMEEEECVRQAHIFREMGFGGYHMHSRSGLATPYLGEKFISCVKACVEDAKANDMLAWLYDEDRYPSGFAGGFVTKDGRLRRRGLVFTSEKRAEDATYKDGRQTGGSHLLATYAVKLCFGKCASYRRLAEGEKGCGKLYYAYLVVDEPTDGFNLAGYADALCKEALDVFADYTYGTYQKAVSEEFGKTIPSIFTDEPQMKFMRFFRHPLCPKESVIAWTDDFAESYKSAFGEEILDVLPEVFFDTDTPTMYRTRFRYHTHRTERFAVAFNDNLGRRAEELGIHLTGHMMEEPTLETQSIAVGEAMRQYKEYGLPGIDMLCGRHEYTTALQTRSVVRQEGREGMLCECYGVSRWALEFGKFKEEGDWLACLGVTVRVPHLSFYTMKGEAKRDYPPSIFYQAPWYQKYKQVEDHFSRLNTALTRGKAVNEVAVIHPIESYFIHMSGKKGGDKQAKILNKRFLALTDWLLFDGCDFDYISESLLPSQRGENPLAVGTCTYKTILVPSLLTMRAATLDYLRSFRAAGGKVVFLGEVPSMVEGAISGEVKEFAKSCIILPFEKAAALSQVSDDLVIDLCSKYKKEKYLATVRADGDDRWVFVTSPRVNFPYPHSVPVKNERKVVKDTLTLSMKGEWSVTLYDTMTGEIRPLAVERKDGVTKVTETMYNHDSLLLFYEPASGECTANAPVESVPVRDLSIGGKVSYTLHEPNALFLDKAKWSVGGGYHPRLDLDLVTAKARKALGMPKYRNNLQPWIAGEGGEKKNVYLRFEVESEVALPAHIALEQTEYELSVNGVPVTATPDGYYVDKVFRTLPIEIKKGLNVIDLTVPLGEFDCLENLYLLGEFGVKLSGTKGRIVALPEKLSFRDLTKQYMPFYGGKITYHTSFVAEGEKAEFFAPYASALLTVSVNGVEKDILYAPYTATFETKKGENTLDVTAYVHRENMFGAVHIRRKFKRSDSPSWYHKTSILYRVRRYVLDESGILADPVIRFFEK